MSARTRNYWWWNEKWKKSKEKLVYDYRFQSPFFRLVRLNIELICKQFEWSLSECDNNDKYGDLLNAGNKWEAIFNWKTMNFSTVIVCIENRNTKHRFSRWSVWFDHFSQVQWSHPTFKYFQYYLLIPNILFWSLSLSLYIQMGLCGSTLICFSFFFVVVC